MKTISLCMIVKDEEKILERCLDSIKNIIDEIIIVDTGSTDNTKNIAYKYTNKVYDFEWVDDFAKARNYSFSKATKDYIMWLDADDVILEEDNIKLQALKKQMDGTVDIYSLKYDCGHDVDGTSYYMEIRARIFKRENKYRWIGKIHEVIIPFGNIIEEDIIVTHKKEEIKDPERNLKIFEKMIKNGDELDIREKYLYGRELMGSKFYNEAKLVYEELIKQNEDKIKERFINNSIIELYDCYKLLNEDNEKRLDLLFLILKNTKPSPKCCCKIGDVFFDKGEYETAMFWYEMAIKEGKDVKLGEVQYNDVLPYMLIGICYYYLGDIKKAYEYNEKAGKISPHNNDYLRNKEIYNQCMLNEKNCS